MHKHWEELQIVWHYLCIILAAMFKQLARIKPMLPNGPVRYHDDIRNIVENINIFLLYLKWKRLFIKHAIKLVLDIQKSYKGFEGNGFVYMFYKPYIDCLPNIKDCKIILTAIYLSKFTLPFRANNESMYLPVYVLFAHCGKCETLCDTINSQQQHIDTIASQ